MSTFKYKRRSKDGAQTSKVFPLREEVSNRVVKLNDARSERLAGQLAAESPPFKKRPCLRCEDLLHVTMITGQSQP